MSAEAVIEFAGRPLERIPADLAVVAVTADERPFRGGAGRVDWRLCSLLSELTLEGHITGTLGEAVLLPGTGRLAVGRILVIGAGPRGGLTPPRVRELTATAVGRSLALGASRVALPALGWNAEDWVRLAEAVLAGIGDALDGADPGRSLALRLDVDPTIAAPTLRAFAAARLKAPGPAERIRLPDSVPEPETTADVGLHPLKQADPAGNPTPGRRSISPASSRY